MLMKPGIPFLLLSALIFPGCTAPPQSPPTGIVASTTQEWIVNGHRGPYYSLRNIGEATICLGFSGQPQWEADPQPVSNPVAAKDPEGYDDTLEIFDHWIIVRTVEASIDGFYLWYRQDSGKQAWENRMVDRNLGFISLISKAHIFDGKIHILTDCYIDGKNPTHKKYLLTLHPNGAMEHRLVSNDAEDIQITDSKLNIIRRETKIIETIEP